MRCVRKREKTKKTAGFLAYTNRIELPCSVWKTYANRIGLPCSVWKTETRAGWDGVTGVKGDQA